jgi:hypoxanthine phosphoribosyltransferase
MPHSTSWPSRVTARAPSRRARCSDIVDTGLTLGYLQDILRARSPRSLRTACLLSKPSRRQLEVKVEYIGFSIEDKFVVGYGLDYAEKFRNLPYIAVIED